MEIQWYPGHMKKALRQMQEDAKLIDLVIEILDARIPRSSHNPDVDLYFPNKAKIIFLNKADLANEEITKEWIDYYKEQGILAVSGDARNKNIKKLFAQEILKATEKKRERDARRGIKKRPVRTMVVGIPNGGKSTFINTYAGKASAKTGNKPGVTRGKQWIRLSQTLELLDTPGILWPKFEDPQIGLHLALIGSIREEILGQEELAVHLIEILETLPSLHWKEFYGLQEGKEVADILSELAKKRGCIKSGGEADTLRASKLILDDFRSARLGRISLERVE